jgi:hypothetical protein
MERSEKVAAWSSTQREIKSNVIYWNPDKIAIWK